MIKNYTTTISATKTIHEIEQLLIENGARRIHKEYDSDGNVITLVFSVETLQGEIVFKLPCEFKKLKIILLDLRKKQKIKIPWKIIQNDTHAINVGWRIIKDWVHAQMSFIQIEMATLDQIFLPYAYNIKTKQTIYEQFKNNDFQKLLAIGDNNE